MKKSMSGDYKRNIFEKKYRYSNETTEQFYDRVSNGNADIRQLMIDDKFIFGGRILSNRGLYKYGIKSTYSNCYVVPSPKDNIESIYDTARSIARIYSYSGGCGVDLSNLRPSGSIVNNSAKTTSGLVSFMPLFDITTKIIGQFGRRGALMMSLICTHPDIIEFIKAKDEGDKITSANISVRFTDEFLIAARDDRMFNLHFKVESTGEEINRLINARSLMMDFAYNNFSQAEPGALFWDRVISWNLMSEDNNYEYESTNPCGEIPTIGNGSCLLGSINLSTHVINPFTSDAYFDMQEFNDSVRKAVVALNEVLDEGVDLHPSKEISDIAERYKQIGLGLCGYADMLIKLGVKYGSQRSLIIIDEIGSTMINSALQTSAYLARDFGAFPAMNKEKLLQSPFLLHNASSSTFELISKYGLRNSSLLCLAPTGSTAPMVNASWAGEPIYDVSYSIKTESLDAKESHYKVFTPIVSELMNAMGIKDVSDLPDYVVSAMQIPWRDRIRTQSHFQSFIDSAISSTVNLPEYVGVKDVYDLYMYAWEQGLKGVTVYRDNCDRGGVLTSTSEEKEVKYCPTCGNELALVEGCKSCQLCGFSMCGL